MKETCVDNETKRFEMYPPASNTNTQNKTTSYNRNSLSTKALPSLRWCIQNKSVFHRKYRNTPIRKWHLSCLRLSHISSSSAVYRLLLFSLLILYTMQMMFAFELKDHDKVAIKPTKFSQPFNLNSSGGDGFHPIIFKKINQQKHSLNDEVISARQNNIFGKEQNDRNLTFQTIVSPITVHRTESSLQNETLKETASTASSTSSSSSIASKASSLTQNRKFTSVTEIEKKPTNGSYVKEVDSPRTRQFLDVAKSSAQLKKNLNSKRKDNNANKELENLLAQYVENFFEKGQYKPEAGLITELQKNNTKAEGIASSIKRSVRGADEILAGLESESIKLNMPRALATGRLFFFTGLKKVLWPVYMGLQILKSVLLAMLLPALIGSVGKLLGKGILSGSAPIFIRPMESPQDLDFKDSNFNFDDDKFTMTGEGTKDGGYVYNAQDTAQTQNHYVYDANSINQESLSRYGMNEQQKMQDSYLAALQSLSSASFKNSGSLSGGLGGLTGLSGGAGLAAPSQNKPAPPANANNFQTFQKVPASSLLLSNYDPFYSPLLSRLDSVFAQLKLNSENEVCREKLICLMYANPAKYAPYSNLVSAQLSRELNELRKPTSDNPDILRFFKYMRAAKDGQDGVDCEQQFDKCTEFKDFENPAMVSTYHDINKLVQARKMS